MKELGGEKYNKVVSGASASMVMENKCPECSMQMTKSSEKKYDLSFNICVECNNKYTSHNGTIYQRIK